jgi:hypothetical protein
VVAGAVLDAPGGFGAFGKTDSAFGRTGAAFGFLAFTALDLLAIGLVLRLAGRRRREAGVARN